MTALISEFGVSPGITFTEVDQTTVTPAVDTTAGAIGGVFRWGPVNDPVLVTSEVDLATKFGKPTNLNAETWFSAANFLAYSNSLYVVRAANTSAQFASIASETGASAAANITVLNQDDFATKEATINASGANYVAKWPGALGDSLKISVCETSTQFNSTINLRTAPQGNNYFDYANTKLTIAVGSTTGNITLWGNAQLQTVNSVDDVALVVQNLITLGDLIEVTAASGGAQRLKVLSKSAINANTTTGIATFSLVFDQPLKISNDVDTAEVTRYWEYAPIFETAPGKSEWVAANGNTALQIANAAAQFDEMHVAVIDEDGLISGTVGAILETYQNVSRATDAKTTDGATNYYKTVINNASAFVWAGADRTSAPSAAAISIATATSTVPLSISLTGGVDQSETAVSFGAVAAAYDKFASVEDIDISLIITGMTRGGVNGTQLANYLIDNVAEVRRDCVVFVSPEKTDVVNAPNSAAQNVVDFRNALRSSSYAVLDSGYKYQYDKYNDVYRYIPLNADIAGLCVRTDATRDPWFSPAGVNRGSIRNVVKLPFNPKAAERDLLYKNGVNPVITQQGLGTILFGDKTLLATPSAFDRINVRRLFITLQKAITRASNALLFEFNDEFTRAQFRNIVEPFLRDVQGRRGITDFKVVCDETNNTPQVIDTNRFVGDIYIKPARSINFIRLNFIAVRTGVEFTEIVGQ